MIDDDDDHDEADDIMREMIDDDHDHDEADDRNSFGCPNMHSSTVCE